MRKVKGEEHHGNVLDPLDANEMVRKTAERMLRYMAIRTRKVDEAQRWLIVARIVNYIVFKMYKPYFSGSDIR